MAILKVDCDPGGRAPCAAEIARAAGSVRPDAPTVVMIHGYRYDPRVPAADPHASLYRDGPTPEPLAMGGRAASWPHALGFTGEGAGRALCVGFGWRARAAHLARFLLERRNGFAAACAEAERAGAALASTAAGLADVRGRPVDVFAHSLGARVALAALRVAAEAGIDPGFGRFILMGPAAFAAEARAALDACDRAGVRAPETYCMLARGNAPYDRLFETFGPWGRGPSLGRAGLGARRARWMDLAFDDPAMADWAASRGIAIAPAADRPCHWSFYTRPGAPALHRAILTRAPGFGVEEMRASGAPVHAPAAHSGGSRSAPGIEGLSVTPA
jgi:hypothetical protein